MDTNVILEAHRTRCWNAIASNYQLHTVEKVIEETQTGHQNRSPEQNIDEARLREDFAHVSRLEHSRIARFLVDHGDIGLDAGERDLVIYGGTLGDETAWLLTSPDTAVVRHAVRVGWLDRLVALQTMTELLGRRPAVRLRDNFTRIWLQRKCTQLRMGIL